MRAIKQLFKGFFSEGGQTEYTPTPVAEPSRAQNFNRFSDLLPYSAWISDARLFVLEGDDPESVNGLGFCLEMIPQTGARPEMADLLCTLFTYMPRGSSIQWTLIGSPLIDDFLDSYLNERMNPDHIEDPDLREKAEMYLSLANRRAAYFAKGATQPLVPNAPYLLREFKLVMSVTVPATSYNDEDQIAEIISLRETCITALKTYYQYSHEWTPEDLINWCSILTNPQESFLKRSAPHINYDDGKPIKNQIVAPNTVMRVTDNGLLFGLPQHGNEIVARCMSVRSYPKACTLHAMGSLVGDAVQSALGYTCPFAVTIGIVTQDFEETRAVTQMKAARATQKADSPMARFMPELQDMKRDWDIAQKAFDDGSGTVKIVHQAILFAKPSDISRAEQAAQAVWRSMQYELVQDTFMQVQGYLTALPMTMTRVFQSDVGRAQRFTTKTIQNAVNMAPLLAEWHGAYGREEGGARHGPVMALWGRRGQAMGIDLFANTAGNYNACVVGTSGSGKSVFLNDLCLSYLSVGAKVWIIDIGRSYEKVCQTVGGQYIEFTQDADICLNPFSMVDDINEDMEMLVPLFGQMISPTTPLDDYRLRQLGIHIQSVWFDYGKDATIDHLAYSLINNCEKGGPNPQQTDPEWVAQVRAMTHKERQEICDPRIRDMGVQLYPYSSDGPYGKYFSGPANVNFESDFIVLELEELSAKKDLQAVVMFLLMYKITQEMYLTRDKIKLCVIDEAWSLLGAGSSGDFIESGYRRARKYKGSFITATQSVQDYWMSKASEAALNNSDWMFLLRQKPESVLALEKADKLVLDEHMKDMLLSIKTQAGAYSEVFVHAGQMGHGVGRVMMDPFSLLLVSSKAEDYEAIRRYRMQGLSVPQAIEAVLRDRGVKTDASDLLRRAA